MDALGGVAAPGAANPFWLEPGCPNPDFAIGGANEVPGLLRRFGLLLRRLSGWVGGPPPSVPPLAAPNPEGSALEAPFIGDLENSWLRAID